MDIESEIRDLKRRVGDLEITLGVLTGQLRMVKPGLDALRGESQDRFDRTETALARLDQHFGQLSSRMNGIEVQIWSLRDDLPEMLRAVLGGDNGAP